MDWSVLLCLYWWYNHIQQKCCWTHLPPQAHHGKAKWSWHENKTRIAWHIHQKLRIQNIAWLEVESNTYIIFSVYLSPRFTRWRPIYDIYVLNFSLFYFIILYFFTVICDCYLCIHLIILTVAFIPPCKGIKFCFAWKNRSSIQICRPSWILGSEICFNTKLTSEMDSLFSN